MILYLDSSDLFKLYVLEPDSDRVEFNTSVADQLAGSRLSYAELRAGLARAQRGHRLLRDGQSISQSTYDDLVRQFESDWRLLVKVNVSQRLIGVAGQLAAKHFLTGGDAIQLSAALTLRDISLDEVRFSVADKDLKSAAIAEGFVVV